MSMTKEQLISAIFRTGDVGRVGQAFVQAAKKEASEYGVKR